MPEPDAGVTVPVPGYLRPVRSAWLVPARMAGRRVVLEPLDRCHAAALFAALDDPRVHRHSVWYALLADDWPAARDRLTAHLTGPERSAGHPPAGEGWAFASVP